MNTERFFNVALPHIIIKQWDIFTSLKGSISFKIENDIWSFHLGNISSPIQHSNICDLNLRFSHDAFQDFINGRLDVATAVKTKRIEGSGDFQILNGFERLIRPPTTVLGLMLNR